MFFFVIWSQVFFAAVKDLAASRKEQLLLEIATEVCKISTMAINPNVRVDTFCAGNINVTGPHVRLRPHYFINNTRLLVFLCCIQLHVEVIFSLRLRPM